MIVADGNRIKHCFTFLSALEGFSTLKHVSDVWCPLGLSACVKYVSEGQVRRGFTHLPQGDTDFPSDSAYLSVDQTAKKSLHVQGLGVSL